MLSQAQRTAILELSAQGSEQTRDRARAEAVAADACAKCCARTPPSVPEIQRAEKAEPYRQQILELLASCKGNLVRVHEELVAERRGAVLSGADGLLPPARHRANADRAGGPIPLRAGRGDAARHVSARGRSGRQEAQGADRLGGVVLLAHVVLPDLSDVSAFRLQGVSHRRAALHGRRAASA